jgi:hypothetical protein
LREAVPACQVPEEDSQVNVLFCYQAEREVIFLDQDDR